MNQEDTTTSPVLEEGTHADNFAYSLVLADVIYNTEKGIGSQRCQLFSKSLTDTFPAARLGQIQNSAAHQVKSMVNAKQFKAVEVILLNIQPLGWMTDLEFWGSEAAIPDMSTVEAIPQESSTNAANVVTLVRP